MYKDPILFRIRNVTGMTKMKLVNLTETNSKWGVVSPVKLKLTPCKGIQEGLGFRTVVPDSKGPLDVGFQRQTYAGFRIPLHGAIKHFFDI